MKSIINYILLTFLFTFTTVLFSQQRGNKGSSLQQKGQNSQMMIQAINPENMAKIIMYDTDEIIKKLRIKNDDKKAVIIRAISKHNNKINEIKTFNYETFDKVKSFLSKKRNEAALTHDFSNMKEFQLQANEMLTPIRSKIILQKNTLNATFEKELSEKQYKTWLKYQQTELKKLNPKAPENQQSKNSQKSKGSGQKRGMGRSSY
ncbi:hypothetical protein BX611_2227 [Lutibacter oceani]|uniref:Uncharacterized protein n=1 Tax=Lutibacter oceani TaxID=1853311 RepID=A0A3D9RS79_9FLAO|nr:hypothetical protein [Lutibacter oceani]REE80581.1 hypothetical protein BX611_2227 [Lutibacter oceani]